MSRKIWVILIVGIVLRLVLSATAFHWDVRAFDFAGKTLISGHVLNLYEYLPSLSKEDSILKDFPVDLFNYPPAVYFFFGFSSQLSSMFTTPDFYQRYFFDTKSIFGNIQLNIHLLLFKLPYIFFDLGVAFLLMKLFSSKREQFWTFTLWIFNPITLFATYMMGQFDIIPTFFVVLTLYIVTKAPLSATRLAMAGILLGIGAAFKIFPLFMLIPLASFTTRWCLRFIVIAAGIIPYLLVILPYLPSRGFRSTALVANQTLKSLYAQIPISGGESIILFPVFLILFYLLFLYFQTNAAKIWIRFFVTLLLFFVFTHYHPQWLLWLTPFLVIDLVKTNFKNLLPALLITFSWFGLLFFFDPGLTVNIFAPLFPALASLPSIWELLGLTLDINYMRSILQTIFVGSALYLIYYYFPKKTKEN